MKHRSALTAFVSLIGAFMVAQSSASAQDAISFNLGGGADDAGNAMAAGDTAGAPGARVANWNNVTGMSDNGSVANFANPVIIDSKGVPQKKVTATITAGSTGFGGNFKVGDSTQNDAQMFNGVFDQYDGSAMTINVTNIPYAKYNVCFYMRDDGATRAGSFTVGGKTLYMRGGAGIPDTTGAGYVQSKDTTGKGADTAQGNYVQFTDLTGDLTADVVAVQAGDDAQRCKVSGFQIVQAAH